MTLIQTVVTDDFVIQVSDRRLSRAGGAVFDDEYTKLVCWNYSFTAGFTGLARIDRRQQKSAAEWIAEVLSDCPVFDYGVNVLRTETQAAIRKLPNNWDKRLAIAIAGFEAGEGPLFAEVANFDRLTGKTNDQNTFRLAIATLREGRRAASHTAGALLSRVQTQILDRYVPRIVAQPEGPNRAIRIMVENQRLVAGTELLVGEDALCVYIPRAPGAHNLLMSNLGGPDLPTTNASFGFFPKGGFEFKQYGPLLAAGGLVQDQVEGSADPQNPDNQTVGMRLLKVPPSWTTDDP